MKTPLHWGVFLFAIVYVVNNGVDYSSLPTSTRSISPKRTIAISIIVTLLLLVVLGPFLYIQTISPKSSLGYVPGIAGLVTIPVTLIAAYVTLRNKFLKQCATMRLFAQQNGWQFKGGQRLDDPTVLPTGWGFLGNSARQIYHVQGSLHDTAFDLYATWGIVRTTFITPYGSTTLGYRTVIRTHMPLNSDSLPPDVQVIRESGWNYVVTNSNAITANEIEVMFQPLRYAPLLGVSTSAMASPSTPSI